MKANKKMARTTGILFIVATAAGAAGAAALAPILTDANYLINASAYEGSMIAGVIFTLIMALSVVGIPITMYPVLKKQNRGLAMGYVGARFLEAMFYFAQATLFLTLLTLSREFIAAGTPDNSYYQTLGALITAASDWSGHVILDLAVFSVGALVFNLMLFKSRLVPRIVSGFGIIGAIMYFSAAALILFGHEPLSTIQIVLSIPLALSEIVLALWLIIKGFNKTVFEKIYYGKLEGEPNENKSIR